MHKLLTYMLAAACVGLTGCGNVTDQQPVQNGSVAVAVAYCGTCGYEEGAESCCVKNAKKCSCGMDKGSPLCCKVKGDFDNKTLCGLCGHVLGTTKCCVEDAKTCDCGMTKGSPLCCKLTEKN